MPEPITSAWSATEDLEDLFERAPCGYLSLGADGRVTRINLTLLHWLGLDADAVVGKHFRELLTVPSRIFYETNFAPLLRLQGGFEEVALDLITAGGAKTPVLVNALERRDAAGLPRAVRVVVIRATNRRRYERDLQGREATAVQRLEDERAVAELREQFIAVLGHDLRNPLASIVGAGRLLRREALSEKAFRILDLMDQSVGRMVGLIDDVMDFARARLGGGIVVDRKVQPLEPVLRQVVAEMEIDQPSRSIDCEFALTETISFDEGRIAQLVSNLLGNAFTHGDPKQPVRLSAKAADGRTEIAVANAGEAIPPAAMERLFQPFFREELRSSHQGLGLGLHIASEIARAHGGSLQVKSDEIETRFTLVMPSI